MRITNVVDYLDAAAEKYPDKAAFIGEKSSIGFGRLKERTREIATFLTNKGIYREPVIVFMEKSPEEAAVFLSVIRAGNYHIAVDMEMSEERISHILEIASARLMICDETTKDRAKSSGFTGEIVSYESIAGEIDGRKLAEIRNRSIDTDPIYVVFTSGSTGVPKGVIATHGNVIDYIEELSKVLCCSEDTVFGNQAPFYLDACLKDFYTTLKFGATTYLIPKKLFAAPVRLIEYLNENKINTICFVVSALTILTKLGAFEFLKPEHLKVIAFGGEVFPLNHLKAWMTACPEARFINLYGPTECTGMSSYYVADKNKELKETLPIGKPFPNTDIFLLDEENRLSQRGEICIRGAGVAAGYYRDEKRTLENFVRNPLNSDYFENIYRTGDIGYFNENGELCFVGRKDNQIKHLGYRIELEEIETAGNGCENVAAGISFYDGENEKICFIYEGTAKPEEVKLYFRKKLPSYMVPGLVEKRDRLPVTTGGKPDRVSIKRLYMGSKN